MLLTFWWPCISHGLITSILTLQPPAFPQGTVSINDQWCVCVHKPAFSVTVHFPLLLCHLAEKWLSHFIYYCVSCLDLSLCHDKDGELLSFWTDPSVSSQYDTEWCLLQECWNLNPHTWHQFNTYPHGFVCFPLFSMLTSLTLFIPLWFLISPGLNQFIWFQMW